MLSWGTNSEPLEAPREDRDKIVPRGLRGPLMGSLLCRELGISQPGDAENCNPLSKLYCSADNTHTNTFLNLVESHQIRLVITLLRLILVDFLIRSAPLRSENFIQSFEKYFFLLRNLKKNLKIQLSLEMLPSEMTPSKSDCVWCAMF